MNEVFHDSVYLDAEEFVLLAGAAGIEQIDGIFREPVVPPTDQELYLALAGLCSRGLLQVVEEQDEKNTAPPALPPDLLADDSPDESTQAKKAPENGGDGYFQADPVISASFRAIRDARLSAMFFAPWEEAPSVLAYLGEQTAVLQVSASDRNAVRVFTLPFQEFIAWMEEEGSLPPGTKAEELLEKLETAAGLRAGEHGPETAARLSTGENGPQTLQLPGETTQTPPAGQRPGPGPCLFVRMEPTDENSPARLAITGP